MCGKKDCITNKKMQLRANCTVAIRKCGSDFLSESVVFNMKWWGGAKYSMLMLVWKPSNYYDLYNHVSISLIQITVI